MTERYVAVVMPDGYRVRVARSIAVEPGHLFSMVFSATGENGETVWVRGNHVARIWIEQVSDET